MTQGEQIDVPREPMRTHQALYLAVLSITGRNLDRHATAQKVGPQFKTYLQNGIVTTAVSDRIPNPSTAGS